MIVSVIGKRIVCGKNSKSGKWLCGTVIHTTYADSAVEGTAVKSFWVGGKVFPSEFINVGNTYNLTERNHFVIKVERIDTNV